MLASQPGYLALKRQLSCAIITNLGKYASQLAQESNKDPTQAGNLHKNHQKGGKKQKQMRKEEEERGGKEDR